MDILAEFSIAFRLSALKVIESAYWKWSVRPSQITLGSGIISLKRPASSLAELTPDEAVDFVSVVRDSEAVCRHAFKFDKINYLMLMMRDPQLHFHVIPRYATPRVFECEDIVDAAWPGPVTFKTGDALELDPEAVHAHLVSALQELRAERPV